MFLVLLVLASLARAQQNVPRTGYAYPPGGKQGTTVQVVVGGQYLEGVSAAQFSGRGVRATVVDHFRPLTPFEINVLRDKIEKLQQKRVESTRRGPGAATRPTWTAADEKELADIRKKLAQSPRRPENPQISEKVTLSVTIDADAAPGLRELRLLTPQGLTNPVFFCVGVHAEFVERELRSFTAKSEMSVTIPAVVNGQIQPGDVDQVRFKANKGQKIVVTASARSLVPYLPDAVPGWFQATMSLLDAQGNEIAYVDDFRFNPDPVLFCEIPADGEYLVQINDAIYRGRDDFVYRITLGELPFVTGVFPLGGRAGTKAAVELRGWNLPVSRLTLDLSNPGIQRIGVGEGIKASNTAPFAVDDLPECLEREPNDKGGDAQAITSPIIVNGRIERSGDEDAFRFQGKAGEKIIAEVMARRLDSPLDSVLRLTDASGKQIAINDDCEDKGCGLTTHHADSVLRVTLPADGAYELRLSDAQRQGGPEYAYRLRLGAPRPDYELRIAPAVINLRGGASAPVAVYALRKDGFAGAIDLVLKDAPRGFRLDGARIPAGQDHVRLTLTAPPANFKEPIPLAIEGRAMIAGNALVRDGVPAEDMMQAFIYRHLVPMSRLEAVVTGRWVSRSDVRVIGPTPLKLPAGGTCRLQLTMPMTTFSGKMSLELSDPPEGVSIRSVGASRGGTEVILACDSKARPGQAGNLIFNSYLERTSSRDGGPAKARKTPVGMLPAVPYEIVAR